MNSICKYEINVGICDKNRLLYNINMFLSM
jgi:hypothetical protein